jgi:hypothetical protein
MAPTSARLHRNDVRARPAGAPDLVAIIEETGSHDSDRGMQTG